MSKSFRALKDRRKSAALQSSFPVHVPIVFVACAFGAWLGHRLMAEHFGALLLPTVAGLVALTYVIGRMHRSQTPQVPSNGASAGAVPQSALEPGATTSAKSQSAKAGK